jgi:hypothetical protein
LAPTPSARISSLRPFAGYVQEVERELVGAIDAARGVTIGDA